MKTNPKRTRLPRRSRLLALIKARVKKSLPHLCCAACGGEVVIACDSLRYGVFCPACPLYDLADDEPRPVVVAAG